MDKLEQSLHSFNDSVEKVYPIIPGEIGITLGGGRITEVPGRGQFVYVRLRSNTSEIIQVFNGKVFPGYGLPVLVKWNSNRYEIVGVDVQRYQQWLADNPHIAKHGATHSMDRDGDRIGTDPVWVYPYQFMPSLVAPYPQSGVQNVYINPMPVQYGGSWKYLGNTGTSGLTSFSPVSGSSIVLISLDMASGNPYLYATTGTYIPSSVTGTLDLLTYLPYLDPGRYIPLSFVILASGTTGVTWNNLVDVRQFFSPQSTGSSFLSVNGYYPINNINFTGGNIISSGTTAFLEFVGGSGGGTTPSFIVDGYLETGTSQAQPYLITSSVTANYAYLYLEGLGVTGTTRVDIKKNGISIFTGGYSLSIPYSLTGSWVRAVPFYTSYVLGDILTLDILEKASGAWGLLGLVTSSGGSGSSSLSVVAAGGTPSVSGVTSITFPSGSVSNLTGGAVSVNPLPNVPSLSYTPTGTHTTTSASYADISSAIEISITKVRADSNLLIDVSGGLYATAQPTTVGFGLSLSASDYDLHYRDINAANTHIEWRAIKKFTGLGAGVHTFRLRWKRISGSGTLTSTKADRFYMRVEEVQ